MIQSIQKVIKIGSSGGVTIPAKEMKRQNIQFGDEVEVVVRPIKKPKADAETEAVLKAARQILQEYRQDFENLSQR